MCNKLSFDFRGCFKRIIDGGMRAVDAGRALLLSPAIATRWSNMVQNGASLAPSTAARLLVPVLIKGLFRPNDGRT